MIRTCPSTRTCLALARLRAEERGSLTIFGLVLFLLMVMIGGFAVDLMRFESTRTALQNTLDRSTLAAASLTQDLDSEEVVEEYFAKAGLSEYLTDVQVTEGINFKEVDATALAATNPFFLHMIGIDAFDASGRSAAEQRITNVEIALVLDVSGSMSGTKIANLKTAANEFVNTVLSSDGEDRISITLVPYNGQVNLGALLAAKYNIQNNPNTLVANLSGVNCVDLDPLVYGNSVLSRTDPMQATAHVDNFSTTTTSNLNYYSYTDTSRAVPNAANRWCPPSTTNIVRLPSNDIATLQAQINGLTAIGATSINAGLKWGLALLDPSARPMFSQFAASSDIPAEFDGRPYEYTDPEALKIVVLMTDGEHFPEYRMNPSYTSGLSPIWRSAGDGNYSIHHPDFTGSVDKYWVPHLGAWRATAWTNDATPAVQLTWPEVWAGNNTSAWPGLRVTYVAWQLYARALGTPGSNWTSIYNTWMTNFRTVTATNDMDTQLQQICTRAKNNHVTVYGIAFEAPANGQTQISQCATSAAHYFNAQGLQIRTAFRAIASNISQLRLTQ